MDEKHEIPEAERPSPPLEPFEDLKAIREAAGLSLPEIFERTRVTPGNLAAVESGEFELLPPPVYARNFIRKYARAVGIDEQPILNRYERFLQGPQPAIREQEVQKPWPETRARNRFLFGSLAGVIAVGLLVSALFLYDQAEKPTPPPAAPPASPSPAPPPSEPAPTGAAVDSAGIPVMVAPMAASSSLEAIPPPAAEEKGYRLVIEAKEQTWVRITAGGSEPYQALLNPGDKVERTAANPFQLDIGNAGGIQITFQGKPLGSPGRSGQVVHMRLPEQDSERTNP